MTASVIYFAYGSNMLQRRLMVRCPNAKVIGHGYISGFSFTFDKCGEDNTGKAGLIHAPESNAPVHGVLYRIDRPELRLLDQAEWEGRGYDRHDGLPVVTAATDRVVRASTYVATNIDQNLQPFDWYKDLVVAGAEENGLPQDWLDTLRSFKAITDPMPERQSRLHALELLRR